MVAEPIGDAHGSTSDLSSDRAGAEMPDGQGEPPRPVTSVRFLWINAGVLLVLLFALLAVLRPSYIAVPDEGLYLAQADALVHGSWSIPLEAPEIDPDGLLDQLSPQAVLDGRVIPYARHATYPLLLAPAYWVAGQLGTLLVSVLGTWGAALSAAFIARRVSAKYGPWALWMVGIASPLVFYAFITMAHSLTAAAAGFAFLGVTRAVDDRRPVHLVYGLPCVAAGVMLRSEGMVFALAFAVALAAGAVVHRRSIREASRWLVPALGVAIVGTAAYLFDMQIDEVLTGQGGYGLNAARIVTRSSAGPVAGTWASLLRPFHSTWADAGVSVPLGAAAIILGALSLRLVPSRPLLPLALSVGAALAGIGVLVNPPGLVTGLFAAFPVMVAGLIWIGRSQLQNPLVLRGILTASLSSVALIATLYEVGGASEWGGRFFSILLPMLVPIAVLGLDRARGHLSPQEARIALGCLAVFTTAMSVSAIRSQVENRAANRDIVESSVEFTLESSEPDDPLLVVAKLYADGSARAFWDSRDSVEVVTAYNLEVLPTVLELARDAGHDQVAVQTNIAGPLFGTTIARALDDLGWEVLDSAQTPDGNAVMILVGEPEHRSQQ